jgi:hypothetical protein
METSDITMTRECVFHIGYPKTASTFLQRQIFENSQELLAFTALGDSPGHNEVSLFTNKIISGENTAITDEERARRLLALKEKIDSSSRKPILSHESMIIGQWQEYYTNFENPETVCQRICEYFPQAKIMICIRDQVSWLDSWFRHDLRGYNISTKSISEIIDSEYFKDNIMPFIKYNRQIKRYQDLFGKRNIGVFFFADLENFPDIFVSNISSFLDIEPPVWRNVRHRPGYSRPSALTRRYLNKAYLPLSRAIFGDEYCRTVLDDRYGYICKKVFGKADILFHRMGSRSMFGRAEKKFIGDLFREDNQELSELLNVDVSKYGFAV